MHSSTKPQSHYYNSFIKKSSSSTTTTTTRLESWPIVAQGKVTTPPVVDFSTSFFFQSTFCKFFCRAVRGGGLPTFFSKVMKKKLPTWQPTRIICKIVVKARQN